MNKRMQFTPAVKTLAGLINEIKNLPRGGLDLQPKYQREYIWKDDFKDKLIYSIIRGYPIGSISIGIRNEPNIKRAMSEVVDGQQRLTTIFNFVQKNYEVKPEYAMKIAADIVDYLNDVVGDKELESLKNRILQGKRFKLTYKMLPEIIKDNVLNYQLSISNISEATEEQITEYFRFLQNQEILRAGEIINSLPDTNFENYLLKLKDKARFMKVVGYKDDRRRDFDKIFYSTIGVLDESLPYGAVDASIKKYITETSNLLGAQSQQRVCKMIHEINNISDLNEGVIEKCNKRYIKFLLMLLGLDMLNFVNGDYTGALKKLSEIDKRLSVFSSAKEDIVENTFSIFQPAENIPQIIKEYRKIALFSKGIQKPETAINIITLLSNIIERELAADNMSL